MLIHGREINFLLSTGAVIAISKVCPDNDIDRLGEVIKDKVQSLEIFALMASEMSKAYEAGQAYEDGGYKGRPLTYNEVLSLPMQEYFQMVSDVMAAYRQGRLTSVETEPVKKKENPADPPV